MPCLAGRLKLTRATSEADVKVSAGEAQAVKSPYLAYLREVGRFTRGSFLMPRAIP